MSTIRAPAFVHRSIQYAGLQQNVRRYLEPMAGGVKSFHSSARASSTASSPSAIPHISVHIAASSSGKGRKFRAEANTYDWIPNNDDALGLQKGSTMQEKRSRRQDSGQDAYFVARVGKDSNVTAFAIADGVGGWTEHGIDPADFSHGLCSYMASRSLGWTGGKLNPKHLLSLGYQDIITDPDVQAGGTTACVAVVEGDGRMFVANLGDSGFVHLRAGSVHHYSDPQTHAFNTPYQMSLTPPEILAQAKIFGGTPLNDAPDRADLVDHMLRHGDVLVMGSDGVWDNLDAQDVLKIVSNVMREAGAWQRVQSGFNVSDRLVDLVKVQDPKRQPGTLQGVLAATIVGEAKNASQNQKRDGPFAKAVQKEYPYDPFHGGKVDDIAVLVVIPVDHSKVGQLKPEL